MVGYSDLRAILCWACSVERIISLAMSDLPLFRIYSLRALSALDEFASATGRNLSFSAQEQHSSVDDS